MVTKQDVAKTTVKENKKKKGEGYVYGTINEVTDFYPLHKYPVELSSAEKIVLKQHFENIKKALDKKDRQIETLKEVIQSDRDRLKKVEAILKKYGFTL